MSMGTKYFSNCTPKPSQRGSWTLADSYDFIILFLSQYHTSLINSTYATKPHTPSVFQSSYSRPQLLRSRQRVLTRSPLRRFHNYFVTNLPSSSLHPDLHSPITAHHKLPRSECVPHQPGTNAPQPASLNLTGHTRELTVVRIPLQSAKHHFGVSQSRGTRPHNEDTYQAGTLEIPAFAKRAPISLSRGSRSMNGADSASGDPQVFYFGVFDGHGGSECSEFLKKRLHDYVECIALRYRMVSSLQVNPKNWSQLDSLSPMHTQDKRIGHFEKLDKVPPDVKSHFSTSINTCRLKNLYTSSADSTEESVNLISNEESINELERSLVQQWKEMVGGYFRRFRPEYFTLPPDTPTSIESILMYAFLKADLDFISAQVHKPTRPERPSPLKSLDNKASKYSVKMEPSPNCIGGPTRFIGGSTASIAMISTPTPMPFWHPASPSTMVVAHVGDTRIILCNTATGLAKPCTTNHHPSSPGESNRLRRYATSFITDSFGEERMSGLANTRAFGDMNSKRVGVSAEPEIIRIELAPAEYSMLILISDGVSGSLSDQEIVDIVKEAKTPEQGARDVVSFATEVSRNGDNATCLVVRLGGWERRGEGGVGSLGTKEGRDWRRGDAVDLRKRDILR
ncbi:BgTH12-01182 [Blumeria graminis f. sp. triticale]|uniref:BgTH12-01182 n=1 Tax=Blumeria graminis f. sp. triticale TaxID=1689686 RepID=A0A9W4D8D3_BLUGR|nr:BgTH12-01182 [Blumeria graminis f. sp. triticale]